MTGRKSGLKTWQIMLIGIITLALYVLYYFASGKTYNSTFLVYICSFIMAGEGWNVLGGYVGEISFGQAVFFGIGSYVVALPVGYGFNIPLWLLIILGAVISGLFAWLISYPLLRVKGFPFLIGTFGLGIIFYSVFKNNKALFSNKGVFIRGVNSDIAYIVIIAVTILMTIFVYYLANSDLGLSFQAVRDMPEAAEMIGINIYKTKAKALVIGATMTGLAGALYALYSAHITPNVTFDAAISNDILLGSYIGGCGTVIGPVIGGALFIWMQEWARSVITITGGHNLLLGIMLIVVMMTMREGVWPTILKLFKKKNQPAKPENKKGPDLKQPDSEV